MVKKRNSDLMVEASYMKQKKHEELVTEELKKHGDRMRKSQSQDHGRRGAKIRRDGKSGTFR